MGVLPNYLRRYLESESVKNYTKDTQNTFNNKARKFVETGMKDLILIAQREDRISYKWRTRQPEVLDRNKLREFVETILTPRRKGFNDYINDIQAYQRAKDLLEVIHAALNKILVSQKIQDMKLMPNSNISSQRYRNIAALEMMFWAYPDLEKKKAEKG